jgi:hypothetical protein
MKLPSGDGMSFAAPRCARARSGRDGDAYATHPYVLSAPPGPERLRAGWNEHSPFRCPRVERCSWSMLLAIDSDGV